MQLDEHGVARLPELAGRILGPLAPMLLSAAAGSLRLRVAGPGGATSLHSRFGGEALLPAGHAWPATRSGKPLCFIGQINSTEIGVPAGLPSLPAETLLAFFYAADGQEAWGFDPDDAQFWRVIPVELAAAQPVETPDGAQAFASHRLAPEPAVTIPHYWEPRIEALWSADMAALRRLYQELEPDDAAPYHRLFGWPDLVQNPMQLECQLAANGINVGGPAGYRDPRVAGLAAGAAEWLLLLQVDTDHDIGWMWGDVGTIYYWIRSADLRAGRFDRVWMIFQCY
jgi:uncharacterized protein YwqG